MLSNKTVIIGVTGSIAAYKIANLVSMLVKQNCDVHVIMTKNATNFINPITFETLTNNKCIVDTFDRNFDYNVGHVSLADKADLFLVAPASANVIGKLANGIADDMLTTTFIACNCKKVIAPAMNTKMFLNPILQENLKKLQGYEYEIISPDKGRLACGDIGVGKMPNEEVLLEYILKEIKYEKDMLGVNILISAGATKEYMDPVRYISNDSTGKMGIALARCAVMRGANVFLVKASTCIKEPMFVKVIEAVSANEMFEKIKEVSGDMDIIIKAGAVSDYTPVEYCEEKIKKSNDQTSITLSKTTDILSYLGENKKSNQFICGFSMETEKMIENSRKKLVDKKVDMIVANNLKQAGAGFGVDTNIVTLITKDNEENIPLMSKEEIAKVIIDKIQKEMEA